MTLSLLISAVETENWDRLLDRSLIPESRRLYFRSEYAKICADAVRGEGYLFSHQVGEDVFVFPIIVRSIPRSDLGEIFDFESPYGYSGVHTTSSEPDFLDSAWVGFKTKLQEKGVVAGFVRFNPLVKPFMPEFFPSFIKYAPASEVVILDLEQTEAQIFENYESNVRTNIRKAQKNKIIVRADSVGDLSNFQKIYLSTMDRVDAKDSYRFDDKYFSAIENYLKGAYQIFYAYDIEGKVVGGILVFTSGDVATIHLSGCNKDYLKHGVPSLLRHETIVWAKRNGLRWINFGGGKSADPNCTLLKFKSGFSRQRSKYYIGTCIIDDLKYRTLCEQWQKYHPDQNPKYFLKYRLEQS